MVAHPSFVGCPNAISPPIDANAPGAAGSTTLVAAEEMFSHFGYKGATSFAGQTAQVANSNVVRSSVGVGLTWASPFGALTVNYAVPLSKASYDQVQPLSFNAGPF